MVVFSLWAGAQTFNSGGVTYNILSTTKKTVEVIQKDGTSTYDTDITVPATVTYSGTTYTVTSLGASAFKNFAHEITLNAQITDIGSQCFYGSKISSINLPNSLFFIGTRAFCSCTELTEITIPGGVTDLLEATFLSCKKLRSVTLPKAMRSLDKYCFQGCSSLQSINISETVIYELGDLCFYECTNLHKVELPITLNYINRYCFNSSGLREIEIPMSVIQIGERAFGMCEELKKVVFSQDIEETDPTAWLDLPDYIFSGCTTLEEVYLPLRLRQIGSQCFYNCQSLQSIEIPKYVTKIGAAAFNLCPNLIYLKMNGAPSGCTLASNAFSGLASTSTDTKNLVTIYSPYALDYKTQWPGFKAYRLTEACAAPVITLDANGKVSITCPDAEATIGYTLKGVVCQSGGKNIVVDTRNMSYEVIAKAYHPYKGNSTSRLVFPATEFKPESNYNYPVGDCNEDGLTSIGDVSLLVSKILGPQPTTGKGKAIIYGKAVAVPWVQLWNGGPRFAAYNVGATSATEYGDYYAWGSTTQTDPKTGTASLTGNDDTATSLWGSKWRMPTKQEIEDLRANCDETWVTNYENSGVNGRLYRGKGEYSDNTVFFPAKGMLYEGEYQMPNEYAMYWTTTAEGSDSYLYAFMNGMNGLYPQARSNSAAVRPVLK